MSISMTINRFTMYGVIATVTLLARELIGKESESEKVPSLKVTYRTLVTQVRRIHVVTQLW